MKFPHSWPEDGTILQTDEPADIPPTPTTAEAARIVQGGLAYLTDIERRLAPYFERAEPHPVRRRRARDSRDHPSRIRRPALLAFQR
jgi:hypothetical protein